MSVVDMHGVLVWEGREGDKKGKLLFWLLMLASIYWNIWSESDRSVF